MICKGVPPGNEESTMLRGGLLQFVLGCTSAAADLEKEGPLEYIGQASIWEALIVLVWVSTGSACPDFGM